MGRAHLMILLACPVLVAAGVASAQEGGDEAWLAGEEGGAGEEAPAEEGGTAQPGGEDEGWLEGKEVKEVEAPVEDTTYTLREQPGKWYYAIGGRFHYMVIPGSVIEWFPVEMSPTVQGYNVGIEAEFRRDGLSIVPFIQFGQAIGAGTFQEDKDPLTDVEWWKINLKLLMIGIEFFGSVKIRDWVQYYYGAGIAFFFRLGEEDMVRTEAYLDDGKWHACDGPAVTAPYPGGDPLYCEATGGNYDQNWEGWGANPFYIPYLTIVPLGFRFKPIPNLYVNFDAGIVLPMIPTLGIRAGYIF